MELSVGDVTNDGTINLSGSNVTQIFADGTLFDYGTIIDTASADFDLHSDGISPTTLWIEPGGSYLFESDSGINDLYGSNVINNQGMISKTAGTGTSSLSFQGQLINTGTIEADSGTLDLEPTSFDQLSGGTLTGGTWNAMDGATLQFPAGTAITTNAGDISLGGAGATIAAIAGLGSTSGSFTVTGGAGFTTTGDFANSGSLVVGPGSTFSVVGNFTQTSAGSLGIGISGVSASGQYGQIVITGAADLDGTLRR